MNKYVPYLGVAAAIVVFGLFIMNSPFNEQLYQAVPSPLQIEAFKTAAPAPALKPIATTSPAKKPASTKTDVLAATASQLRKALVNIICYAPADSGLHSISGSGVVISSKGMILTNAHIAQYYLLTSRGVSCDIRTGSPAVPTYKAGLAYISPKWVEENVTLLMQDSPLGTGERDFALLAIMDAPSAVPYVPLAYAAPGLSQPVAIATYGAQGLTADQIKSGFFPTVVLSAVKNIYTFTNTSPDVIAFTGTPAAQEGSSGGGVVDTKGSLVATVVTSNVEGAVSSRSLSAITAAYVRAEYARETGQDLTTLLAGPNTAAIAAFEAQTAQLTAILEKAITSQ